MAGPAAAAAARRRTGQTAADVVEIFVERRSVESGDVVGGDLAPVGRGATLREAVREVLVDRLSGGPAPATETTADHGEDDEYEHGDDHGDAEQ